MPLPAANLSEIPHDRSISLRRVKEIVPMKKIRLVTWSLATLLLAGGCSHRPALMMQHLSADAPAAAGLPAVPDPGQPSPLLQRPTFGLYADTPSHDTLIRLSSGILSPDGRYRAAATVQGVWVARLDGAWLWQVPLPDGNTSSPPPAPAPQPGKQQGSTPSPRKATRYVGLPEWTSRNTLLLQDDTGTWVEADPYLTRVTVLPSLLQGKEGLMFSPDGKQVAYYTPGKTGKQLWVAKADGTDAKLIGENLIGFWGKDGKLETQKQVAPQAPGSTGRKLSPDTAVGSQPQ
jgi:hypothetical protein